MPIPRTSAELSERIVKCRRHIEAIGCERYPEAARLRQVDGVGPITALTLVLTLEESKRFWKPPVSG